MLEILFRLWDELARDVADWIIRAPSLETKATGAECLRAAARRTEDYERLLGACGVEPLAAPALPDGYSRFLNDLSEAPGPAQFFAAIALFWDPGLREAAERWIPPGKWDAARAAVVRPALDESAARRLVDKHFGGAEGEWKAAGWANHLCDCLSAAGGFHPAPAPETNDELCDYVMEEGEEFALDSRFERCENETEARGPLAEAARHVASAEMAALAVFENWHAHLLDPELGSREERLVFRTSMFRLAATGLRGFDEAARLLDGAELPQAIPLPMNEYRAFRLLPPRDRMSKLIRRG
ncbi:MAG: hypothetical protein NTW86_28400 [Candidatus Sumerlaeota bacterium]|nr:hypothetical protein [Candidatus Sumerlaeota bacterium]